MIDSLRTEQKMIGVKQSTRAVEQGSAQCAFVASDSAESVRMPFVALCADKGVKVEYVDTMKQLGEACGIDVGSAVAVILK